MHTSKIIEIKNIAEDILSIKIEKPSSFSFKEGQAVYLSFSQDLRRPFSLASKNSDQYLEFIIKQSNKPESFTNSLTKLSNPDTIFISDPFGSISFQGNGVFIAGGTGITPFISILRFLRATKKLKGNKLIFSNKTEKSSFLIQELKEMENEGLSLINTLTRERNTNFLNERVDKEFLKKTITDLSAYFYICGPIRFVGEIQHNLSSLGADPDKFVLET